MVSYAPSCRLHFICFWWPNSDVKVIHDKLDSAAALCPLHVTREYQCSQEGERAGFCVTSEQASVAQWSGKLNIHGGHNEWGLQFCPGCRHVTQVIWSKSQVMFFWGKTSHRLPQDNPNLSNGDSVGNWYLTIDYILIVNIDNDWNKCNQTKTL